MHTRSGLGRMVREMQFVRCKRSRWFCASTEPEFSSVRFMSCKRGFTDVPNWRSYRVESTEGTRAINYHAADSRRAMTSRQAQHQQPYWRHHDVVSIDRASQCFDGHVVEAWQRLTLSAAANCRQWPEYKAKRHFVREQTTPVMLKRDQTFQIETTISVTRSIRGPMYKISYDNLMIILR